MSEKRTLVSFDWAIKNILRDKANYDVLEGFLSTLLKKDITILSVLESEGNQQFARWLLQLLRHHHHNRHQHRRGADIIDKGRKQSNGRHD